MLSTSNAPLVFVANSAWEVPGTWGTNRAIHLLRGCHSFSAGVRAFADVAFGSLKPPKKAKTPEDFGIVRSALTANFVFLCALVRPRRLAPGFGTRRAGTGRTLPSLTPAAYPTPAQRV